MQKNLLNFLLIYSMVVSRTFSIFLGNFQTNQLKKYIFITFMIILSFLGISWIFYPKELNYSIMTDTISYLGDYQKNPIGWVFFSITFIFTSISFIPLILYLHNRITKISITGAWIGTIFLFIGCIGIFLTALLPDVYGDDFFKFVSLGKIHNIVALFGIFGFILGLFEYGILFFIDFWSIFHRKHKGVYAYLSVFPIFLPFTIIGIATLITQIIRVKLGGEWPGEGILSFPLWEWLIALSFFITIYGLSLRLPEKIPDKSQDEE
ncbi:MAG: hypothetical protein ACTSW5_08450 [Promethearchaeota archaeon]